MINILIRNILCTLCPCNFVFTHSVDLWSFGVIIFEMMTNQLPFDGEKGNALKAVIAANIKRVKCHDNGKALMIGLLKVNPKERKWDILRTNKWIASQSIGVDDDEKEPDPSGQQQGVYQINKRPRKDTM